jgi:hypothetical protein
MEQFILLMCGGVVVALVGIVLIVGFFGEDIEDDEEDLAEWEEENGNR